MDGRYILAITGALTAACTTTRAPDPAQVMASEVRIHLADGAPVDIDGLVVTYEAPRGSAAYDEVVRPALQTAAAQVFSGVKTDELDDAMLPGVERRLTELVAGAVAPAEVRLTAVRISHMRVETAGSDARELVEKYGIVALMLGELGMERMQGRAMEATLLRRRATIADLLMALDPAPGLLAP